MKSGSSEDSCASALSSGEALGPVLSVADKSELLDASGVQLSIPPECRAPDVLEWEVVEIGPKWTRPSSEGLNGIGTASGAKEVLVDAKAS